MIEEKPLVSVIMPVYNGEKYVTQALESVFKQDYQSFEVIIVDDGSTDGSREVTQRFVPPVQYHYQPNSGIAAAWNRGIDLTKGDFIAFNGAVETLRELRQRGITCSISSIIMRQTIDHLKEIVDLAVDLEIPVISMNPYQREISGLKKHHEEFEFKPEEERVLKKN